MGTILVLAILCAVVFLIVRSMQKEKQQGGACGSCSGCAGCHMHGDCTAEKKR